MISLNELKKILDKIPKKKIELDNNSWGDVSIHYEEYVTPDKVLYEVEKYLKNEKEVKREKLYRKLNKVDDKN